MSGWVINQLYYRAGVLNHLLGKEETIHVVLNGFGSRVTLVLEQEHDAVNMAGGSELPKIVLASYS